VSAAQPYGFGAKASVERARDAAACAIDLRYAAIYDGFTITLAILLEKSDAAQRGGG
jgi:hypothetical protein